MPIKILDSSVILLFLHDIGGEECLRMLSTVGETLLIPDSVYEEILDENTRLLVESLISKNILKKIGLDRTKEDLVRNRFPSEKLTESGDK